MSTICETINLRVPAEQAFRQWIRYEQVPQFAASVVNVARRANNTLHWTVRIGGFTRQFEAEVFESIPYRRITWRAPSGPAPFGMIDFDAITQNSARMTTRIDLSPQGPLEAIAARFGLIGSRITRDLHGFKRFLEAAQPCPDTEPGWRDPLEVGRTGPFRQFDLSGGDGLSRSPRG